MSRLIRNIRQPLPPHHVLVDSLHRMELIVALLEQHLEVPLVRRFERGSAVVHALATSSLASLQQGILVFGLAAGALRCSPLQKAVDKS